jgi:acyl-CoA thioesterase I
MSRLLLVAIVLCMPLTVMAKSIVVLGDSISAGYGIEAGQGWVPLLQNRLAAEKIPCVISNESISGDTTAGGLARIDHILSRHKPDIVLIELGANDGLRGLSPGIMKSNLAEISLRVQKTGAKVLLLSMRIPPNYGRRYTELFYNVYPELATELQAIYIPFILEDVALVNTLMQRDGLHPNAKAQPMIADKIWAYLRPLLK